MASETSESTGVLEIPTQDGGMVVVDMGRALARAPTKLTHDMIVNYAAALAREAEPHAGWLWVRAPSQACLSAVRVVWHVLAPGWTSDVHDRSRHSTEEHLAALIAHSAISHHLQLLLADTMSPARAAARRVLAARPDLAAHTVLGYLGLPGFGGDARKRSLASMLAVEGSCVGNTAPVTDIEEDAQSEAVRTIRVVTRGMPIERYILELVAAPGQGAGVPMSGIERAAE